MFDAVDLTEPETIAYLALLHRPAQTQAELGTSLPDWSPAKVTRTLAKLVSAGLATTGVGRPRRYSPISPDVALESLARRKIEEVRHIQKRIPELMEQFWRGYEEPTALDFVETVCGTHEAIGARLRQLRGAAREQVRGFERPPHPWLPNTLGPDQLAELLAPDAHLERGALARGVDFRVIYDRVEVDDPARWPDIRTSIAAGEQSRMFAALPMKLSLFDDWAATTPLVSPTGEYVGSVVIHKSPLLDALSALFESYWERSVPLTISEAGQPVAFASESTLEARLVTLLAAGLTDAAIARTLEISRSTVQRRVNELMSRLGARTRFQVGLQLGRQLAFEELASHTTPPTPVAAPAGTAAADPDRDPGPP